MDRISKIGPASIKNSFSNTEANATSESPLEERSSTSAKESHKSPSDAFYEQPCIKLEHIENVFLQDNLIFSANERLNGLLSNAKTTSHNQSMSSSSGLINSANLIAINSNANKVSALLDGEQKILSLQRSISEKLRNSFKTPTNNALAHHNSTLNKSGGRPNAARKWHSERCKDDQSAAGRLSAQAPLNSHQKSILAQYSSHARNSSEQPKDDVQHKPKAQMTRKNKKPIQNGKNKIKENHLTKENLFASGNEERQEEERKAKYAVKIDEFIDDELDDSAASSSESDEFDENNNQKIRKCFKILRQENQNRNIKSTSFKDDEDADEDEEEEEDEDEENNELGRISDIDLRMKFLRLKYFNDSLLMQDVDHVLNLNEVDLFDNNADNLENLFYERVSSEKLECQICLETKLVNERSCCAFHSCNECINYYVQTKIKESCGAVKIECLNSTCNKLIHRDEISERMSRFDPNALKIYLKFLIEANKDSDCKTCPRCSHIIRLDEIKASRLEAASALSPSASAASHGENKMAERKNSTKLKLKFKLNIGGANALPTKVQCNECQLVWCFQCHSPWHDGISCHEFRKGDRMLKYWAKEVHYGQQNAQLCPNCKIYIQRTKGCDHMVCTFCQTEFCYKCGCKFRQFKFVGDHYSRLSIFGCKYRLYPEKPFKRKLIRGGVLCGKVAAAPLLGSMALVVGVGALVVGFVALPAYGSYQLAKHIKRSKLLKMKKSKLDVSSPQKIEADIQPISFKKIATE